VPLVIIISAAGGEAEREDKDETAANQEAAGSKRNQGGLPGRTRDEQRATLFNPPVAACGGPWYALRAHLHGLAMAAATVHSAVRLGEPRDVSRKGRHAQPKHEQ
jgi:hypothetical protein